MQGGPVHAWPIPTQGDAVGLAVPMADVELGEIVLAVLEPGERSPGDRPRVVCGLRLGR